jgi:ABC-type antimicrobial peptide transport system permease subunit
LLTAADAQGTPRVMVINETMARRGWPGEDPIGRRATVDLTRITIPLTIVGVVADARLKGPLYDVVPEMFWPMAQDGSASVHAFVRTSTPPRGLVADARRVIAGIDPAVPVVRPRELTGVLDEALWRPRVASVLFATFASLAVVLAALGLYGVMAYAVGRRTREIGIRIALGDRPGHVMRRVAREGLALVGAGIGAGLAFGFAAAPALRLLLTRESLWDPAVIAGAASMMIAVALMSTIGPARRAASVDPAVALRAE